MTSQSSSDMSMPMHVPIAGLAGRLPAITILMIANGA